MSENRRFSQEFLIHVAEMVSDRPSAAEGIRAVAVSIAMALGEVNVDDLRDCVESDGDNRFFGAVLAGMARGGVLEKFGFQRTRRLTSHGRDIARFRLTPDWQRRWNANEMLPTILPVIGSDGRLYVEEKKVTA